MKPSSSSNQMYSQDLEANWPESFRQTFTTLLGISLDALDIWPPMYISSIFGKPLGWLPLHPYSEYTLLNPWRPLRAIKYLANTFIPSVPIVPPPLSPPFLNALFFRPSLILHRPDHNQDYGSFPDEAWFFINGILTNDSVAQLNAAYLSDLFHRPITIIQNTTQSLIVDLSECAFGKVWRNEWRDIQEASAKAFPPIYEALKSQHKNKVIVIAHSQGTIITSVVLEMLKHITLRQPTGQPGRPDQDSAAFESQISAEVPPILVAEEAIAGPEYVFPYQGVLEPDDFEKLTRAELGKLEIYCFANCASKMTYLPESREDRRVPWIENFGNEFDIVARLGMLAPDGAAKGIQIDGGIYLKTDGWGHMLNEHYLKSIDKAQRVRLIKGGQGKNPAAPYQQIRPVPGERRQAPRLYEYINGGIPAS